MSTLSKARPALVKDDFLIGLESFVYVHAIQSNSSHSEVEAHELTLCCGTGLETPGRTSIKHLHIVYLQMFLLLLILFTYNDLYFYAHRCSMP
jgi:hypothetical protein